MKRFMLISLMSCMFVGQAFCIDEPVNSDDNSAVVAESADNAGWKNNTKEFAKGVSLGAISTGLATVASVPLVIGGASILERKVCALEQKYPVSNGFFSGIYNAKEFAREWREDPILKYGIDPGVLHSIPAFTTGCAYVYNMFKGLSPLLRILGHNSDVTGAEVAHASGRIIGSTAATALVAAGLYYSLKSAYECYDPNHVAFVGRMGTLKIKI